MEYLNFFVMKFNSSNMHLIIILSVLLITSCQQNMAQKNNLEFVPEAFGEIQLNSNEPNICSPPEQEPEWRGILINLPEKVLYHVDEKNMRIPLCGFYQLDMIRLAKSEPIKIVVARADHEELYYGFVMDKDPSPDMPEPFPVEVSEDDMEDMAIGSYFNVNIPDHVNFPILPGDFTIYVEYGSMRSEAKSVKLIVK